MNYYGSKWNAAEWIISHFPEHSIYVEVFGGSGAVLMQKPRTPREVINDIDGEIHNLYKVVRDNGPELKKLLELTPFSRTEYENSFNLDGSDLERARKLCVRAYMGIGNSCNRKTGMRIGTGSTTCTAKSWVSYFEALDDLTKRFQGVFIENSDYRELIRRYDTQDTLFYLDPPYVMATRSCAEQYKHDWKQNDHTEFLELLHDIKGKCVVSGYDHSSYDVLNWPKVNKDFKTQKRTTKTETLWLSPSAANGLKQISMAL